MIDIIAIAVFAVLILTTLFVAFILDGLEEYFQRRRIKKAKNEVSSVQRKVGVPESRWIR